MLKKLNLTLLIFILGYSNLFAAQPAFNRDSLIKIIQTSDKAIREKKLVFYFKSYFQNSDTNQLAAGKVAITDLLFKYNLENKGAFKYFIEGIYQRRFTHLDSSENAMVKAVEHINNSTDHYLLYIFLSHLAFLQTDNGNAIGAVYSYWRAKKEVSLLNDPHLEVVMNINISDLYYKTSFYNQSLFYLDDAMKIIAEHKEKDNHLLTVIYYNKAENFFRMNNADSLRAYSLKLKQPDNNSYKLFTYRCRTDYYIQLLARNYKKAKELITAMQHNKQYVKSELDEQHLADAYFLNGDADSARSIINKLLADPLEANHPEIQYHLYEMLANIAEKEGDKHLAAKNYGLSLKQSEENVKRLTKIGNISSQMKIDEIESSYIKRAETYKRERLVLIFILIIAALSILTFAMFYRNAKQKRHYEKLLYTNKKNELSFINSHEVRKHLTNILGIIDIVKSSEDQQKEYLYAQEHLYYSAEQLDKSIKNIAEKLND
jgi:hypothetical protein